MMLSWKRSFHLSSEKSLPSTCYMRKVFSRSKKRVTNVNDKIHHMENNVRRLVGANFYVKAAISWLMSLLVWRAKVCQSKARCNRIGKMGNMKQCYAYLLWYVMHCIVFYKFPFQTLKKKKKIGKSKSHFKSCRCTLMHLFFESIYHKFYFCNS